MTFIEELGEKLKKKINEDAKKKENAIVYHPVEFYNRYIGKVACAYREDISIDFSTGKEKVNATRSQTPEKYIFKGLKEDCSDNVVLIEVPPDCIPIEFETHDNTREKKTVPQERLKEWIAETAKTCQRLNYDYCICSHGGTSDYLYLFGVSAIIEGNEKECREMVVDLIIPPESKNFIDRSNLAKKHLIPIIGRPHWKPKYKGAIHQILEGKNPMLHNNRGADGLISTKISLKVQEKEERDKTKEIESSARRERGEENIDEIPLSSIISLSGLKNSANGELYGSNPWHGSAGGCNFWVNTLKNTWFCFRCHAGAGAARAIALNEGIINSCGDTLDTHSFIETIKIAQEKYGLKKRIFTQAQDATQDSNQLTTKPELILPHPGKLISNFADEVASVLKDKEVLFYRTDSRDIVEIEKLNMNSTGFLTVKPNRLVTFIEQHLTPGIYTKIENRETGQEEWTFKAKSISSELANSLLSSQNLHGVLPQINRIFTVPIPIIYQGKLTFPKKGYDPRFNSWLSYSSPDITDPHMPLHIAKAIIHHIYKEFCFQEEQDKTNAISAILTPFLRGLFTRFNCRTPVFFWLANRERAGKDFGAGIRGIIYDGYALEEAPISNSEKSSNNNDELRKKLLAALIYGRKLLHFANNKGYLDNAVFEGIVTSERYSDRLLGKSEIFTFDNEIDFSLSGNVGVGFTPDFANRSKFIRLFLEVEDANSRKFENPDLHKWIKDNRGLILSAFYSLVQHWVDQGMPSGTVPFTSFGEWARVCSGIMEAAGYSSPCNPDKDLLGVSGDLETADMKTLFEVCYNKFPDRWLTKQEIREMVRNEGCFQYLDLDSNSDQAKFGFKLSKFVGRMLSNIKMVVKDASVRNARQHLMFTKQTSGQQKLQNSDQESFNTNLLNDYLTNNGRVGKVGRISSQWGK